MSLPPIPPAQPGKPAAARKAAAAAPPFSSSWPCASLHRRPPPSPARPRPQPRGRSCESLCAAAGPGAGEAALRLSLSLPPEAARVLQRRSLEKQQGRLPPGARGGAARRGPRAGPAGGDLRALLKISLLNERHRYDDVEYEEEAAPADEGLVRKCTEWLRGVESAAGRDRDRDLETLPHLGAL